MSDAKIYVVANQKGGAGKTTMSMMIGACLSTAFGHRTLILDTDRQGTAQTWYAMASEDDPFPCSVIGVGQSLHVDPKVIVRILSEHAENFDRIIVDCPASVESPIARFAALCADLVLIVVPPSPPDMWSTVPFCQAVEEAQERNPDMKARILINGTRGTKLASASEQAAGRLRIPVLKEKVKRREFYMQAAALGASTYSSRLKREAAGAKGEIEALVAELEAL